MTDCRPPDSTDEGSVKSRGDTHLSFRRQVIITQYGQAGFYFSAASTEQFFCLLLAAVFCIKLEFAETIKAVII